jgi:hypothetical protein
MHRDIAELKTAGLIAPAFGDGFKVQTTEAITQCAISQPVRVNAAGQTISP